MANNNVSSLLGVDFPQPKQSNFNLGRVNFISADVGYIYPIYVEEILPKSFKRLDVKALVQTNATVAPVMGRFTCKLEAFFIPLRIYFRHLMDNDRAQLYNDDFDYHYFPWLDRGSKRAYAHLSASPAVYDNLQVQAGSLLEYLGMFPARWNTDFWSEGSGVSQPINAIPFIGYFDIYRNYYSNPHDPKIPFRVYNAIQSLDDLDDRLFADMYVDLEQFDRFINDIRSGSISDAGTPAAVDVLNLWRNRMVGRYTYADGTVDNVVVPFFKNQLFGSSSSLFTGNALHYGLLRRTYKDDYFNSRFQTGFVDYMEQQSRVDTSSGSFTISQLRLQNRLSKYLDKSIFSDTRFGSWLKAHFGTKLNDRLDIPQFLGSMSFDLNFNDIVSTAQTGDSDVVTSNDALGSRAGLGSAYAESKGSFVEFYAKEPGYLMVNFSIVPNVSYTQGIRKMYLKNRFSDLYVPEFDAVGYQDLQRLELDAIGASVQTNGSIGGTAVSTYNTVVGKHPAWLEYMTAVDESHGLMQERLQYGFWTLNRPFNIPAYFESANAVEVTEASDLASSTYIYPELFNTIFSVTQLTDNFQCRFRFFDKTKQPISKQILPHL